MKLSEIKQILECEVQACANGLEIEVASCLTSDMMSDILAFARPGALLVTGLTKPQSIRTAAVADAAGIVYVRGRKPDESVIQLAETHSIPVLTTELGMFDVCGKLYAEGLEGIC